jgi:hypothetical protein
LEQSRRFGRGALIGVAVLLLALLGLRLFGSDGPETPQPAGQRMPQLIRGEERVVVEVLNGTDRRGLARLVTRLLRQGGLDVVYFGTADPPGTTQTEVLVRRGDDSVVAARIVKALGAGRVRRAPAPNRYVDLTVLIGADYVPPPTLRP